MTDIISAVKISQADLDKIRKHLSKIKETQSSTSDLGEIIGSANTEFNKLFINYGQPGFTAKELKRNDTPSSELYNTNLQTLSEDLDKAYLMSSSAASSSLSSFNFAKIVTDEITNQANALASKVLDLNILNNFTKGQVIVAGDDFIDKSKIDSSAGVDSSSASVIDGANAIGLEIVDAVSVTQNNPNITVTITPIMPATDGKVNVTPTPGNLERFYEGRFYAFMGQQDPEGGTLQLKYIVDPSTIPEGTEINKVGFFSVAPSSEEEKQSSRKRMFDGNPDTYWQCEFCYKTEPLIADSEQQSVDLEQNNG